MCNRSLWFLLVYMVSSIITQTYAVSYSWTGSSSSEWTNTSNWTPTGVPSVLDDVVISAKPNAPRLAGDVVIAAFTLSSGTIDLAGYTLTITGNATFSAGTISSGQLVVNSPAAATTRFGTASGGPTIYAHVNVSSGIVLVARTVFWNEARLTKTGSHQSGVTGGNTFHGPAYLTNTGTISMRFGVNFPDTFNREVHVQGSIIFADNTNTTVFNEDILLYGGNPNFGASGGTSRLKSGKCLRIAQASYSGTITIRGFRQEGSTPQELHMNGGNGLRLGPNTVFEGDVDIKAGGFFLDGCEFMGEARLEKITTGGFDQSQGGNFFHGPAFITNSSSRPVILATVRPDIFRSELTITAREPAYDCYIRLASTAQGTRFEGDVYFNVAGSATISTGGGGGTVVLAEGKRLMVGSLGVIRGGVGLSGLHQQGTTGQTLVFTGSGRLSIGAGTVFEAPVDFTASSLTFDRARFATEAKFTKTGTGASDSYGGNIFLGKVSMRNTATGNSPLNLATSLPDTITY